MTEERVLGKEEVSVKNSTLQKLAQRTEVEIND